MGNGLVNWLALQRLSQIARLAFNNPGYSFDALVYKRNNNANQNTVVSNLQNNMPVILEEPGHFVLATGTQENTFRINDPYYNNRHLLTDGYNNTFLTSGEYIPSHTDLSYMMLVGDQNTNFSLTDANGNSVGEQFSQQPLEDQNHPGTFSGNPVNIFYLQTPKSNAYSLTITSTSPNQSYTATAYTYDIHGNVTITPITGTTNAQGQKISLLSFQKISFATLLADLQNEYNLKHLGKGAYETLTHLITNAQNAYVKKNKLATKAQLNTFSFLLKILPGISADTKTLLQKDLTLLLQTL